MSRLSEQSGALQTRAPISASTSPSSAIASRTGPGCRFLGHRRGVPGLHLGLAARPRAPDAHDPPEEVGQAMAGGAEGEAAIPEAVTPDEVDAGCLQGQHLPAAREVP